MNRPRATVADLRWTTMLTATLSFAALLAILTGNDETGRLLVVGSLIWITVINAGRYVQYRSYIVRYIRLTTKEGGLISGSVIARIELDSTIDEATLNQGDPVGIFQYRTKHYSTPEESGEPKNDTD